MTQAVVSHLFVPKGYILITRFRFESTAHRSETRLVENFEQLTKSIVRMLLRLSMEKGRNMSAP